MKQIRLILLLFGFLGISPMLMAQDCGTHATPLQIRFMEGLHHHGNSKNKNSATAPQVRVPLKIHIVRQSDGTGGISESQMNSLMNDVNAAYAPANMEFYIFEGINFIDDSNLFDIASAQENDLAGPNDVARVVNVYFPNSIVGLCGYTRFPPSTDRVFVSGQCAGDVTTFAHELGHYFTLFHTHGKTNTGTTDELVARINCDILGDNICDTPADPNLTGKVNASNCSYTGNDRDANGETFNPMVSNYMAYAPDRCQTDFTRGQYDRIRDGLDFGRNYLNLEYIGFTARFSNSARSGCAPLTVSFSEETLGSTIRRWEFTGADVAESFNKAPTVTYSQPGIYNVRLIVENGSGDVDTITRNNFIEVIDPFANVADNNGDVSESFTGNLLPNNWEIVNPDKQETFVYSSVSRDNDGSGSFFVNNRAYEAEVTGQVDELIVPNYRLGELSKLTLNFDYAYTYNFIELTEISITDTLGIAYSTGCEGESGNTIFWERGGAELATADPRETEFVPLSNEWQSLSVELDLSQLSNLSEQDVIKLRLINKSYNGNNLYVDNFEVTPSFEMTPPDFLKFDEAIAGGVTFSWRDASFNETGFIIERSTDNQTFAVIDSVGVDIKEYTDNSIIPGSTYYYRVQAYNSRSNSTYSNTLEILGTVTSLEPIALGQEVINLFPNPGTNEINLELMDDFRGEVEVEVHNSLGQLVFQKSVRRENIDQILQLETKDLNSGLYFISVRFDNKLAVDRLMINKSK